MSTSVSKPLKPAPAIAGVVAYSVPKHGAPVDIKLDANEGRAPTPELLQRLATQGPDVMRRYPDATALQQLLATRMKVAPAEVIVTAGADDALDRLCRAMLAPGRRILMTNPSFEMLPRYARITGAEVDEVPWWDGPFPVDAYLAAVRPETTILAVVSPNNPTGLAVTKEELLRIRDAAPDALLLLDHAYVEFADEDLTEVARTLPNTVIVRTLSKAWGLAGLRVGYAIGAAEVIGWMRAAGGPYAISRPSLSIAAARLELDQGESERFINQVKKDRAQVHKLLDNLEIPRVASQGNFVFVRTPRAGWIRDALAGLGIAIRAYPGHPELGDALRITMPGDSYECARLCGALKAALVPRQIVVPMHLRELGEAFARDKNLNVVVEASSLEHDTQWLRAAFGWYIGDQVSRLRVARHAGLVPIALMPGLVDDKGRQSFQAAGAARVINSFADLEEVYVS